MLISFSDRVTDTDDFTSVTYLAYTRRAYVLCQEFHNLCVTAVEVLGSNPFGPGIVPDPLFDDGGSI